MPHDVFGFGVILRFLMKIFYGRHFFASLWYFDAVAEKNNSAVNFWNNWKKSQYETRPYNSQFVYVDGGAVKEVEKPVVILCAQTQGANDAGYAQKIWANSQSRQCCNQPEKASRS